MRGMFVLLALLGFGLAQTTKVYTSLESDKCKTLEIDVQSESSTQECAGFAGYRVFVDEGDLRQNIRIKTPEGKEHSLELWSVVGSGFSSLGPKLEWRLKSGKPFALILRFNLSENPEDASKITSYLVIVKITDKIICATQKIPPSANANLLAQKAAEAAITKACLK